MSRTENMELIEALEQFYRNYYREEIGELAQNYPDDQRSLYVDWDDLYRYDPDLADDYLSQPTQLQQYAEEALRLYDLPVDISLGRAHVRIYNLPESTEIGSIKTRHIGELIEITGTVDTVEETSSALVEAAYECQRCGTLNYIPQSDVEVQEPHECQGCERDGPFRTNLDQSELQDSQLISIQETAVGLGTDADRNTVLVRIRDDVTDSVTVGDPVRITGIVHKNDEVPDSRSSIPDKYLDGVSIQYTSPYPVAISDSDEQTIRELAEDSNLYEKLVDSFAPSVYNHQDKKLALLLQLFSGVTKQLPDNTRIRGDIHIALIGDPGTAKTRLLRRAAELSPRSVLVSGNNTTAVGLTASAERTSRGNNTWTFEAGALPKADRGLACIDNLDHFGEDERASLHDAMEDQVINLSKGSSTEAIQARASVLAAGAPRYGRFDQYETMNDQLDIGPSLLSQFDLIFTITDQPEKEEDNRVAKHILDANLVGEVNTKRSESNEPTGQSHRFQEQIETVSPEIEADILRKYIIYARENIHPTMDDAARETLREFYISIRENGDEEEHPSIPITARKLEGLVRLSEASARIRLSDTVEAEDVERVLDLVKASLADLGIQSTDDDTDVTKVEVGSADPDEISNIKQLIASLESEHEAGAPVDIVLESAKKLGLSEQVAREDIENLKNKGEVFEPATGHLRTA